MSEAKSNIDNLYWNCKFQVLSWAQKAKRPEAVQVVSLFVSRRHVFAITNAKTVEAGQEVVKSVATYEPDAKTN